MVGLSGIVAPNQVESVSILRSVLSHIYLPRNSCVEIERSYDCSMNGGVRTERDQKNQETVIGLDVSLDGQTSLYSARICLSKSRSEVD